MAIENYPIVTLTDVAYAGQAPTAVATFKFVADDFIVRENLSFTPEGEGTHAYLYIEKTQLNTVWLAEQLALFAKVPLLQVGYAGMKDRFGVTSQWYSINLQGINEPDWESFPLPGVRVLQHTYHPRKLKIGTLKSNSFSLKLRDCSVASRDEIINKLILIKQVGFPNYFGGQRFGFQYSNLAKARDWFAGKYKCKQRQKKSIYLSAVRAMLFNQLLSSRICQFGWHKLIAGEVMTLDGSHSFFSCDEIDEDIIRRFQQGDIHPSLCLWGKGESVAGLEVAILEQQLQAEFSHWCLGLENKGLEMSRRPIRVIPQNISWENQRQDHCLQLHFELPAGSYATALLREIIHVNDNVISA